MPIFQIGPFVFVSGNTFASGQGRAPTDILGPDRGAHVVEHVVPGRTGGIIEALGQRQNTYQIRGFLAPRETIADSAGTYLSGASYYSVNADTAKTLLTALRLSGSLAVKIESTYSMLSGYPIFFENDMFYINDMTFGMEPGRGYPYYPYTIELHRTTPRSYGNSSGAATYAPAGTYFSGYVRMFRIRSGAWPLGETINTIAIYAQSVASGNAKVAVYPDFGGGDPLTVQGQSASQPICSGWNYFSIQPSFVASSGKRYNIAIMSDATSSLGWQLMTTNSTMGGGDANPQCSGAESFVSGVAYSAAFPSPYVTDGFTHASGNCFRMVIVTA